MSPSLEEVLISVAQQVLVQNRKIVTVAGDTFSVITTPKQKLKQVNFRFDGREFRGLQQNPDTKSRWAEIARSGKKVMQFLEAGCYIAVVAEGKLFSFGKTQRRRQDKPSSRSTSDRAS
jgi:hypothetical protein